MPASAMTDKRRSALKVVDLANAFVLAEYHFLSAAASAFDSCFRFLDSAFGEDAQEPLIFVTKLSTDPVLIRLVANHGSGENMKHNKSLLFTERGLGLLKEIEELG